MLQLALDRLNAVAFARIIGFLDAEKILKLSGQMDRLIPDLGSRASKHCRLIDLTDAKVAA